jgi:hypothetical protein
MVVGATAAEGEGKAGGQEGKSPSSVGGFRPASPFFFF